MLGDLLAAYADRSVDRTFFRHGDLRITVREAQGLSTELAERLHARGIRAGDRLALDLPNGPDFVFALLAGSMLAVSFFVLNHRLTPAKKAELLEGFDVKKTVDERLLESLRDVAPAGFEPPSVTEDDVFVRMFTSGTTGTPKAARLTYGALVSAARMSAGAFMRPGTGCWQLALPMFHVGGLQVLMRSLVNRSPFILYDRFDAAAMLADVGGGEATHVSVVDKMLRDLLSHDKELVGRYEAVLLGGGPAGERTLREATAANVFASYGMTETCGVVAASAPGEHSAGMLPLPGCDLRILTPDDAGDGEIAVSSPSLFSGYERRAGEPVLPGPFADGYFRTGDMGRIADGRLVVRERTADLFVSGGENIYPREIEREILSVRGVEDAAVIGTKDPEWGRRPVAFATGDAADREDIVARLRERLSGFQRPDAVFLMRELPKGGLGKTDNAALAALYEQRVEVELVRLHRISQRLRTPFRTSQGEMTERESVIVEVVDREGRAGYGEGVAFSTPWYSAETVETIMQALVTELVPIVLSSTYLHPAEVFPSLAALPGDLMAKGALEPACWDLYGRVTGRTMRALLAEWVGVSASDAAPAGVSLGVMSIARTLEEVGRFAAKGYRRVKLKIEPGDDVERVRAVRDAFPDLMLMVDANRGYAAGDLDVFHRLDELDLVCVEEPIHHSGLAELSRFQDLIRTPICVDESLEGEAGLDEVLASSNLRIVNLKIGKSGGVLPALLAYKRCIEAGVTLWLGGMYETGVSKYLHAQFETLPGFEIPGDISESDRYFERDVVVPPVRVREGDIVLPNAPGLGLELDSDRVSELLVERVEMRRYGR